MNLEPGSTSTNLECRYSKCTQTMSMSLSVDIGQCLVLVFTERGLVMCFTVKWVFHILSLMQRVSPFSLYSWGDDVGNMKLSFLCSSMCLSYFHVLPVDCNLPDSLALVKSFLYMDSYTNLSLWRDEHWKVLCCHIADVTLGFPFYIFPIKVIDTIYILSMRYTWKRFRKQKIYIKYFPSL
jgi:hypothetical protein